MWVTLDEVGSARVTGSACVPLATAATYVFVAFFVLVIVFVAVPAREEVVRAGERDYTEGDVPSAVGHGVGLP